MKEIMLTRDKVALVDDDDYELVSQFKWWADENRYARRNIVLINGKQFPLRMHTLILQNFNSNYEIDHIDGNGFNNQKSNLRLCSHRQNSRNSKKTKNSSSKYKGVHYRKDCNKYRAIISVRKDKTKKINIHLGYYVSEIDAAMAYNDAAQRMFGEYAKLNII